MRWYLKNHQLAEAELPAQVLEKSEPDYLSLVAWFEVSKSKIVGAMIEAATFVA